MTAVLTRPAHADDGATEPDDLRRQRLTVGERVAFGVLLVTTAVLYLWNLSVNEWANGFYSAAVQAGVLSTVMALAASLEPNSMAVQSLAPACAAAE